MVTSGVRRRLLLLLTVGLVVVLAIVLLAFQRGWLGPGVQARRLTPRSAPLAVATPTPSVATATPASPLPAELLIPAAGVDAHVETVGLDAHGDIGVPSNPADAAWYQHSALPGAPGNAIVDGHLDWWTGPGVFLHLSQVHPGDTVTVVRGDHTRLRFTVTGEQVLSANARVPMSMLTTTGPSTLSLITCYGSWDTGKAEYRQRLIVDATAS